MQTVTLVIAGIALVAFAIVSLINSKIGNPWKDEASEPPGPTLASH
jgi:hypothetical protein